MSRARLCAAFGMMALFAAGCDDSTAPVDATKLPPPTFGTATIEGTVRYVGEPPPMAMIDTRGTCAEAAPIQEETVVVSREGGLRDVVVWLVDAPASDGSAEAPPTLDQLGCKYVPHVIAVQVGQPLRVHSSDAEFHNVHWDNGDNPGQNFGLSPTDRSRLVAFNRPEFIRTRCDVHAWMEAFIAVVPNPFFGVTDRDGRFTIARVPAGTYRAKAWHARLGERTASVTVAADGTAKLDVTYARFPQ